MKNVEDPARSVTRNLVSFLAMACACAGATAAEPTVYSDLARVVEVAPISETVRVPVQREVCDTVYVQAKDERVDGDLRLLYPGLTLSEAISSDLDAFANRAEREQCRWLAEYVDREEPAGYRVTYEYQGQTYTRVFDQRPGSTIKVQVAVQPDR